MKIPADSRLEADQRLARAPCLIVRELGCLPYREALERMRHFTAQRDATTADEIWLLEHPPVYTLGLSGRDQHLREAEGTGIAVERTERGGQATYHGPGQLVAYLLLDLRRLGLGVKELVFRIETALIQTLGSYGIDGRRLPGAPGVYVVWPGGEGRFAGWAKVAALGVRISRGCSLHGLALNVAMDLGPYAAIDACGYPGLRSIDMANLIGAVEPAGVAATLAERLCAHFAVEPDFAPSPETG
jgi:lipoyl(octanoyl) transferase